MSDGADRRPAGGRRASALWWAALAALALVGLVGRCWRLDFDARQHQHPDERFWSIVASDLAAADAAPDRAGHGTFAGPLLDWLDADVSPANPYRVTESFVYGPAPLAASRAVAGWLRDGIDSGAQPAHAVTRAIDALGVPLLADDGSPRFDAGYQVDLVGRLLGALLDTGTVVVVGLLGRAFAGRAGRNGRAAGLIAAALYATCPLAIQSAHFMSSEPALGLATALTLLAAVALDRSASVPRSRWHGARLGAACGATVAVKLSGAALAAVPIAGCAWLVWRHRRPADAVRLAAALIGAALAFRVLHPAAFDGLGWGLSDSFRADITRLRHQFEGDTPPSIQWAGRTGPGQAASWLWRFTFGPGLCLGVLVGALAWIRHWRTGGARWPAALAVAAVVVPGAYVVVAAVPSGRYFVPALPGACALAGVGVLAAWDVAARFDRRGAVSVVRAAAAAMVVVNVLWGAMFVRGVYGPEYTRVAATEWIAANVPAGSVLTSEAWDDGLPLALEGIDAADYRSEQLQLIGTDSVDKLLRLVRQLQDVDYVVESSPRLWGTVGLIPERFGSTIRFFEGLDTGVLGFDRVATFDRDPMLGPLRLDDVGAEEAFSVYDHPEVRIWKKVREVPPADLIDALDPVAAANAIDVTAALSGSGGLLLTPTEQAELIAGPTWDEAFSAGPGWLHALAWVLLLELLAAAAWALWSPLFGRLPDAGWGIAKLLGLAGPAIVVFAASAWLDMPLDRLPIAVCVAAVVAVAAWRGWRDRERLRASLRSRWRTIAVTEAVTLAALVGMLALRAANPDLWHPSRSGEKPFEMAVLTAVLRSDGVPPYDAWFSGGVLNYYYGGYLLLLAPARLLATAPGLTLNIGVAVFAGAAAGAAASAGALLTTGMRGARRSERRSWLGALAAVGTLAGANVAVAGETWRHWRQDGPFDWWSVSRVVPGRNDITEFPAWTFVFADLHPHLMSTALVATMVVVVAVVFQTVAGPGGLAGVAAAGLLAGALVGLVRATNTWDFPLAAGGVLAGVLAPRLWGAAWRRCAVAGVAASVTALGLWRPYVVRGQVFDSGVQRAVMHTPWASWATQFGWFAALTAVVVGPPLALAAWRSSPVRVARRWRLAAGVLGAGGTGLIAAGALLVWPWAWVLITTLALASACAWAAWQRRRAVGGLALAVTAAGWAIQAGVELVTVRNDIGRQNTVFKFWYQSWVLLAVGLAAVLVVHLTGRAWRPARWAAGALATGGAALALAFWALAVPARVDDRVSNGGWTLDGERYLSDPGEGASAGYQGATFRPADDWVLVEWLRGNVAGGVVAEAAGDDYQWTSRVAWLTGLPTPAGWRFHESQQRRAYGVTVDRRHSDLALLYTTTEPAEIARILASYTVAYVVVGTVERALASPESSAALSGFECLSVVFEHGQSYVASVDRACAYGVWRDALVAELAQPPT